MEDLCQTFNLLQILVELHICYSSDYKLNEIEYPQ